VVSIGSLLAKREISKAAKNTCAKRSRYGPDWWKLERVGQCLGARQDWQPALAAFERACELRPEDSVPVAFRAKVLASLDRRSEAIDCYRKAVKSSKLR